MMATVASDQANGLDQFKLPPSLNQVHPALRPEPVTPSKPRRFASLILSLRSPKRPRPAANHSAPATQPSFRGGTDLWKPLPPVPAFRPSFDKTAERSMTPSKASFCHPIPPGKRQGSGSTTGSKHPSTKSDVKPTPAPETFATPARVPLLFSLKSSSTMPEHYSFYSTPSFAATSGAIASSATTFDAIGSPTTTLDLIGSPATTFDAIGSPVKPLDTMEDAFATVATTEVSEFPPRSSSLPGSNANVSFGSTASGSFPTRTSSLVASSQFPSAPATAFSFDTIPDNETSWLNTSDDSPVSDTAASPASSIPPPKPLFSSPKIDRKPVSNSPPSKIHPAFRRDITDTSNGGVPLEPETPSKPPTRNSSQSAWWLSPLHKHPVTVEVLSTAPSCVALVGGLTPGVSASTLPSTEHDTLPGAEDPALPSDQLGEAVESLRLFVDLMANVEMDLSGERQAGAQLAGMLVQRAVDVCELRGLA